MPHGLALESAPPRTGSPWPFGPGTPEASEKSPGRVPVSGLQIFFSWGWRKGATSKNVKNRQKVSKSFSTLFDNFRAGQKTSKIVKKCQKVFRHFSRGTFFPAPSFCNPLTPERAARVPKESAAESQKSLSLSLSSCPSTSL